MPTFTVQLSQAFVNQFNASIGSADQRVAFGAALTTYDGNANENFWATAGGVTPFLTITPAAPEPAAWALMILGFGTVGAGLRRRGAIRAVKRRRPTALI